MLFSLPATAALAMASSALEQTKAFNPIYRPEKGQVVVAGSTAPIEWKAPSQYSKPEDTVCLVLMAGETTATLTDKESISCGIQSSANVFQWNVGAQLGTDKVYGIRIELESDKQVFQYSVDFAIKGANPPTSSTSDKSAPKTLVIESISTTDTKSAATMAVAATSAHVKPTNAALGVAVDSSKVDCGDMATPRASSLSAFKTVSPSNATTSSKAGSAAPSPVTGSGSGLSIGLVSLVGGLLAALIF